jgi:(R)-2-hydroxyacyl-CoA dehydratese activating ATPase
MISIGIDIGSTTTKVAVLGEEGPLIRLLAPSGNLPAETAEQLLQQALEQTGLTRDKVAIIASTGYGRRLSDLGDIVMTEIKACALGAVAAVPESAEKLHTIIDVGGQDTKVIALSDDGDVEDFSMNDKCAAGTGRFLEMLASKLDLSYEDFVEAAAGSETMIQMNATCAVFAESEVVGLLARKVDKADIAAAAHNAIATRVTSMTRRVGQRGSYCFVGGGARNRALVAAIEENLNKPVYVPDQAQTVVALGAAIGARNKYLRRQEKEKS